MISRKVWYSLEMRKLICISLLNNWGASLDSMHAKAKIIIEGCPYCLHVQNYFFCIPYFTSYIDVNGLPLWQMCNNLCVYGSPNDHMEAKKHLRSYVHYAKWTLFPEKLPNFASFFFVIEKYAFLLCQHLLAALNLLLETNSFVLWYLYV